MVEGTHSPRIAPFLHKPELVSNGFGLASIVPPWPPKIHNDKMEPPHFVVIGYTILENFCNGVEGNLALSDSNWLSAFEQTPHLWGHAQEHVHVNRNWHGRPKHVQHHT